ncbi:hypothetical protein K469DRAFT_691314 [Zopfia rhizophila CBS 207.26]|uniref:Uncharacterized protein n=1 Tax=Zopfia rhizophila CBS 207.26 TaxID=1314779 RepID=A0A6A6ER96_9PEZI|nr:hypothetical protein K469DRAFT_691314 [Zopfia rhizophila CBS 207.26]
MASQTKKSGIMLVRTRITTPRTFTRDQYYTWTRLHFKDLLDMSSSSSCILTTRFTATEPVPLGDQWNWPYFNTIHLPDLGILQGKEYLEVSRALDIENTRALVDGESPVGKPGLIFDVVDAAFAVYEKEPMEKDPDIKSYQSLPVPSNSNKAVYPNHATSAFVNSVLLCIPNPASPAALLKQLSGPTCQIYADLYRKSLAEAHPPNHPVIQDQPEHLLFVLVVPKGVDGEGVGAWKKGVKSAEPEGAGVWDVETVMGRGA